MSRTNKIGFCIGVVIVFCFSFNGIGVSDDEESEQLRQLGDNSYEATSISRELDKLEDDLDSLERNRALMFSRKLLVGKQESAAQKEASSPVVKTGETMQDLAVAAPLAEAVKKEEESFWSKEVSLDFIDADVKDALNLLGQQGGFNIIFDPLISGQITVHLDKVTIRDAMYLVLSAHNLDYRKVGNSLLIAPAEKIQRELMVTEIIKLRNISAVSVMDALSGIIDSKKSSVDKESNTLVISGSPQKIEEVKRLVAQMDVAAPQVLLKAKILELSVTDTDSVGIDWADALTVNFRETGLKTDYGTGIETGESALKIFKFTRSAMEFDATINALIKQDKGRIIANPAITTMSGKEAEVFIGDKIPYEITTVTGGAATTEVRFVEPGTRLKMTPSIVDDDFVVVKIEPEVSSIFSFRGANDQYPWVRTRQATAYVRVKNGETFVIGGLLSSDDTNTVSKVPFLSSIPLLGKLFIFEKKVNQKRDLLITVTPTIIK